MGADGSFTVNCSGRFKGDIKVPGLNLRVLDLVDLISTTASLPIDTIKLVVKGKEVPRDKKLKEVGIEAGTRVMVMKYASVKSTTGSSAASEKGMELEELVDENTSGGR